MTNTEITGTIKVGGTIFYIAADGTYRHKYLSRRGVMVYARVSARQLDRIEAAIASGEVTA